jgi:hypothetical protein
MFQSVKSIFQIWEENRENNTVGHNTEMVLIIWIQWDWEESKLYHRSSCMDR